MYFALSTLTNLEKWLKNFKMIFLNKKKLALAYYNLNIYFSNN